MDADSAAVPEAGDGRQLEERYEADIPVGIAGCRGICTAFLLKARISASLGKGALEALGGYLDFSRNAMTLG